MSSTERDSGQDLADQIHRCVDRYDEWLRQQRRRPSYWFWRLRWALGLTREPW